jgi:hypothetical protein
VKNLLRAWIGIAGIMSCLATARAAEMSVDIVAGTFNAQSLCDLTVEKVSEILGRPADVRARRAGTDVYFYNQGLMFFFSKESVVGLTVYFTGQKSSGTEGTFSAYAGKFNQGITGPWKLDKFLELFPEFSMEEDVKLEGRRSLLFKSRMTWLQLEVDTTGGRINRLTYSRANLWRK